MNLLIGSRKFIEGWSSWRVSTMTLLYLGQGEGPQIIQLFGRGIRLKGRGHSLRRSSGTPGTPPELEQLETLYIFGLKADYMTKFLEAIDAEEGRLEEIEFPLDVPEGLRLPAPSLPDEQRFEASLASLTLPLENDAAYGPVLDMGPRVFERAGTEMELVSQGEEQRFQDHHLASIDWLRVVRKVEAFQRASNSSNVSWRGHALRSVLKSGHYTLFATNDQMEDVTFLEQAIVAVLKKYIENFHRAQLNSRQSEAMGVVQLDPRTVTRPYVVSLTRDHALLLDIKTLRDDITKWRSKGNSPLPRLYIAPELFTVVNQPLVHEDGLAADVAVSPVPLNSGERAFVEHLEQHWQKEHALHPDVELYLLRNLSASGLGFHAQTGFYPDFILWIKNAGEWRAVFIEPHGMRHEEPVKKNSKLSVFTRLLPSLNSKREFTDANLSLDGFVISQTNGPDIPGVEEIRNKWSRPDEWERLAEHHRLLVPENESQHISLILDL